MEQLQTIKCKSIVVPKVTQRYFVIYYNYNSWQQFMGMYNTPEQALEHFFDWSRKITIENVMPKYYKIIEVDLEIPFVPTSE